MPIKTIKKHYGHQYYYIIMVMLVLAGLVFFGARLYLSEQIKILGGDTFWRITIEADVPEGNKGGRIIVTPPLYTRHIRIVTQSFRHPDMNLVRTAHAEGGKRNIVLSSRTSAQHKVWIEFNALLKSDTTNLSSAEHDTRLTDAQRARYLRVAQYIDTASPVITGIYHTLSEDIETNQDMPERLLAYTNKRLVKSNDVEFDDVEQVLNNSKATTLGRARTFVALCRTANFPARVVAGFILDEAAMVQPYYWAEVYIDNAWQSYDPEKGYINNLPTNYLPFNKSGQPIVGADNIDRLMTDYDIQRNYSVAGMRLFESKSLITIFDLERFEPETRRILSVLLLMPFGVLVTAIFRNFLGVRAYGTFTSTFLALAAIYADWITAAILLFIVVAVGVSGRTVMPDKLERIPRLGIIFVIVMMSMLFGVSAMDYFDLNPGGHIFLLPLIILTTLVDRFYSAAEQYSLIIAIRRLVWTCVIALFCYAIMLQNWLGEWLLGYPELHFITMALLLFIASYAGPTLAKLPGFEWLTEPARKKKNSSDHDEVAS